LAVEAEMDCKTLLEHGDAEELDSRKRRRWTIILLTKFF